MPYTIDKVDVWVGSMEDRPGALAEKLAALAGKGVNLQFVIARRAPDKPGTGVVFLAPVTGAAQTKAAKAAGLVKSAHLRSVRVEGPDKPGLGATIACALAEGGINLRGLSAAALGKRCVVYIACDSNADAGKATKVLKKLLK